MHYTWQVHVCQALFFIFSKNLSEAHFSACPPLISKKSAIPAEKSAKNMQKDLDFSFSG
jgi:hypothetical protein